MANHVTTEWEDIHVKAGNYIERAKRATGEEMFEDNMENMEDYDAMEEKKVGDLEEMEDEFEDEFLKEYREKRL